MMNLGKDDMDEMKLKEIKNGRLAMFAWLGYAIQGAVTGVGPYQNLLDHVASNGQSNIWTSFNTAFGQL